MGILNIIQQRALRQGRDVRSLKAIRRPGQSPYASAAEKLIGKAGMKEEGEPGLEKRDTGARERDLESAVPGEKVPFTPWLTPRAALLAPVASINWKRGPLEY